MTRTALKKILLVAAPASSPLAAQLTRLGCTVLSTDRAQAGARLAVDPTFDLLLYTLDPLSPADSLHAAQALLLPHPLPLVFHCARPPAPDWLPNGPPGPPCGWVIGSPDDFSLLSTLDTALELFETRRRLQACEQKYLTLLEHSDHWEYWRGPDGHFVYISPACEQITGYTAQELQHDPTLLESMLHPADRDFMRAHYWQPLEARPPGICELEFRILDRRGQLHWLHHRCSSTYGPQGEYQGGWARNREITLQKQAQADLQANEEKYRRLFENMQDGFVLFELLYDAHGRVVDARFLLVNRMYENYLHLQAAQLVGRSLREVFPQFPVNVLTDYLQLAQEHNGWEQEDFFPGSQLHVNIRAFCPEPGRMAVIYKDITARKQAENRLRESEEKYRALFHNEIYAICIFEPHTLQFLDVNEACLHLYGYSRDELLGGMTVLDLSAEREKSQIDLEQAQRHGTLVVPLRYHRKKDGRLFPVEIVSRRYLWKGRPVFFAMLHDISRRVNAEKALQDSEQRYRELVEVQGEGVYITDPDANFLFANPAAEALFGTLPGQLIGCNVRQFLPPDQLQVINEQLALRSRKIGSTYELRILRPDGDERSLLITARPRLDDQHRPVGTIGICRDITGRKQEEEKLRYASTHDLLTGLSNRSAFEDALQRAGCGTHFPVSVIMLDVDDLKPINDSLGHAAGDRLLQTVAVGLNHTRRTSDLAVRLGGDEFAVLLLDGGADSLQQVSTRLENWLNAENASGRHPFRLSLSLGSASAAEAAELHDLLARADADMYRHKRARKSGQALRRHE